MAINLVNPLSMQLHMHQQMLYQQHQMALHHHYQQDELQGSGNAWSAQLNNSRGPKLPDDVEVELENKKLWEQFHAETTEMIITKTGRRMFPSVQLKVRGLERRTRYCVLMELAQSSPRRHKYVGGGGGADDGTRGPQQQQPRGWTSAGPSEPQPPLKRRLYVHPDSPATGAHWMQHPLSFSKLKLTNNVVENHSNILLTSMHKYNPRVWIVRCDELANLQLNFYEHASKSFAFEETEFIAVTAYQNENITKLKIDNNPFAKGFRESGQSTCKRKRRLQPDDPHNSASESGGEEEGNVSSSDSDSATPAKRARHSETDAESSCSVSSSDRDVATPTAEPTRRETTAQPRLHRPWCDDDKQEDVQVEVAESKPQYVQHTFLGMHPQYHLMALELARMQQMQQRYACYAAAQHLDFRR